MKLWKDIGFEIEITGDGSPSLHLIQKNLEYREHGETMHHSAGAQSETELIYGHAIREALENHKQPRFLVVGLGLAYIEMIILKEWLLKRSQDATISSLEIVSYESVPELRDYFLHWLRGDLQLLSSEVIQTYEQVRDSVLFNTGIQPETFMSALRNLYAQKGRLLGRIEEDTSFAFQVEVILYDAFSSKTTPHLWQEEFLNRFLQDVSISPAWFSTYSCRASLKNALRANGFAVKTLPGFVGKRKTTFAVKG